MKTIPYKAQQTEDSWNADFIYLFFLSGKYISISPSGSLTAVNVGERFKLLGTSPAYPTIANGKIPPFFHHFFTDSWENVIYLNQSYSISTDSPLKLFSPHPSSCGSSQVLTELVMQVFSAWQRYWPPWGKSQYSRYTRLGPGRKLKGSSLISRINTTTCSANRKEILTLQKKHATKTAPSPSKM